MSSSMRSICFRKARCPRTIFPWHHRRGLWFRNGRTHAQLHVGESRESGPVTDCGHWQVVAGEELPPERMMMASVYFLLLPVLALLGFSLRLLLPQKQGDNKHFRYVKTQNLAIIPMSKIFQQQNVYYSIQILFQQMLYFQSTICHPHLAFLTQSATSIE